MRYIFTNTPSDHDVHAHHKQIIWDLHIYKFSESSWYTSYTIYKIREIYRAYIYKFEEWWSRHDKSSLNGSPHNGAKERKCLNLIQEWMQQNHLYKFTL